MRVFRGALIGLGVLFVVVLVGVMALRIWLPAPRIVLDFGIAYPAEAIICGSDITARCAMDAAEHRNATVAWTSGHDEGLRPGYLVVFPDRLAFQEVRGGSMIATLHSDPPNSFVLYGTVVRTISHGGIQTDLYLTNEDGLEEVRAAWLLDDRRYGLEVLSLSREEGVDLAAVTQLMLAIRYSSAGPSDSR
jgi:hypothetical protein